MQPNPCGSGPRARIDRVTALPLGWLHCRSRLTRLASMRAQTAAGFAFRPPRCALHRVAAQRAALDRRDRPVVEYIRRARTSSPSAGSSCTERLPDTLPWALHAHGPVAMALARKGEGGERSGAARRCELTDSVLLVTWFSLRLRSAALCGARAPACDRAGRRVHTPAQAPRRHTPPGRFITRTRNLKPYPCTIPP
jgi:hypothetical protein